MATKPNAHLGRELRRQGTPAERVLWSKLRRKQLQGAKFRRQQPIGSSIVDFVSFHKKLIIEIDGGQHNEDRNLSEDETRTTWLNSQGFRVVRFWNNDVLENLDGVLQKIQAALDTQSPSPSNSSPIKGEESGRFND